MTEAERLEFKGAICRIAYAVLDIDARMKPSLHDRVEELGDCSEQQIMDMYDQYVEEIAEILAKRIEDKEHGNN